jgi:hypothetical protein
MARYITQLSCGPCSRMRTDLYRASIWCKVGFVHDEGYANVIESAVIYGPNAASSKEVAEHVRDAVSVAVTGAVPNDLLY